MDTLEVAPVCGSIDTHLETEDNPVTSCPRDGFPAFSISRCENHPDTCLKPNLLLWVSTFSDTGPPSAYPQHYLGLWLLRPSCPPRACGWLPALRWERAIDGLRRSEYPFVVVLGRHFTPEFVWSGGIYALTRYPETLSRLGLRFSRFRRLCMTALLPCLYSSFTMTTCSTCRRVRLTAYRLSTLALRHLITSRLP